jgi:hypothetical protein
VYFNISVSLNFVYVYGLTRKNNMLSWELAPYPFPFVATIGKSSICHNEKRKVKRGDREVAIVAVFAHGAMDSVELILTTDE